jgi:hypothetical protein
MWRIENWAQFTSDSFVQRFDNKNQTQKTIQITQKLPKGILSINNKL